MAIGAHLFGGTVFIRGLAGKLYAEEVLPRCQVGFPVLRFCCLFRASTCIGVWTKGRLRGYFLPHMPKKEEREDLHILTAEKLPEDWQEKEFLAFRPILQAEEMLSERRFVLP